jgi:CheY-like chemotaxis protein
LYVEDDLANWEVAKLCLAKWMDLDHATSARATFDALRTNQYDAILMDIELRGSELNGIEITQVLKGKPEAKIIDAAKGVGTVNIPIVFFTAYVDRYDRAELRAAGGSDVATKPAKFDALAEMIKSYIAS